MKYSPVTDTPEIVLAKKNAQLVSKVSNVRGLTMITLSAVHYMCTVLSAEFECVDPLCVSQLNYKAGYEKTKHQYTLSKDLPQIRNAKANAALCSDVS